MNELPFDSLHEECGVFGVFGVDDAPGIVYYGLHALQHRGQEACGIVSAEEGRLASVKGEGLVTEVFNGDNLSTLHGHRPCALLDGRGRRPRERAALRLPAPYG